VWGRFATAGNAGRGNLTSSSGNVERRSSHRLEATARSYAHRAYTSAPRWRAALGAAFFSRSVIKGGVAPTHGRIKTALSVSYRGNNTDAAPFRGNQKQRNALLAKNRRKTPRKYLFHSESTAKQ
jgi:hypothetical protein